MSRQVLLLVVAGIGTALAGLVQDDGTVRNDDGSLCASNENNMIRMRSCNTADVRQIFEYDAATMQVKNSEENTCWWMPKKSDQNKLYTNQKVWLIRCDISSSRLDATQLQFYLDGTDVKNKYTDSVASTDYCLIARRSGSPLKMKPCTHRRTFVSKT